MTETIPLLYSPRDTEAILSVSHAMLYRLINAGRLDARKIGGRTVITDDSIRQFIAGLPKADCAGVNETRDANRL